MQAACITQKSDRVIKKNNWETRLGSSVAHIGSHLAQVFHQNKKQTLIYGILSRVCIKTILLHFNQKIG